ncbi:MAG: type II toxin-antitoxin system PemK/MazF family toxin [Dermatophilaceae bacterium]|nr:type II toxin-antitoxin system PemK/MazF family toxin [Actinomycetales bacterium]MBP8881895.1 type II toxin-antitoxin system PemK/MazF family toxin [Dermatophilaceae bacterium]MBP9919058.1 type II toxin-antitoxin system PemK/MazF family toxin [Dermatophilaceae bacterium]
MGGRRASQAEVHGHRGSHGGLRKVGRLADPELEEAYAAAWHDWEHDGHAAEWEAVAERLGRGVVTIVPLTSNVDRIYPFPALVRAIDSGLPNDSKAQAEQVRTVSIERVGPLLGRVPVATMAALDDALRLHLQL